MTLQEVPVEQIAKNPNNPRQNVSESKIDELAESIDKQGLLQPPLVRPTGDGFELVHGERRIRAVESLGWETVAVNVEELSDADALELAITENLQREDVTPIGEARSYQMLIDEHGLTQAEAADRLGVSQADISNKLRLLDLPDELQDGILRKIFSPWQAREIARVWEEYHLDDLVLDFDLGVREIRSIVDGIEDGDDFVSIEREYSLETLNYFWDHPPEEIPDDWDEQTEIMLPDGKSRYVDRVCYLDAFGEPIQFIYDTDTIHGLLWADRNLDDSPVDLKDEHHENVDTQPIKILWPRQRILAGYNRLDLANEFGYSGKLTTELVWSTDFFKRDHQVKLDKEPVVEP
jgi:ParB family chromosome partitioning protein